MFLCGLDENKELYHIHSLDLRLSCLLMSPSLLSAHITTSFYSLLSSIFLHVTAAQSFITPFLLQSSYTISAVLSNLSIAH